MKKYLLLTLFLPLISFGQQCDTIYPSSPYADTVIYCVDSVSCFGGNDGRIVISVYPDSVIYRYNWDSIPQIGVNINDSLFAGTPGVTITDTNNNYIAYIDISIYEPSKIDNFAAIINPTCFNDGDGSISIITNGGTPPYSYNWSTGPTGNGLSTVLNNISSGIYELITIDHNLCSDTMPYPLEDPEKVTSTTITDTLSCIGFCDGSGVVIPFDGVSPYTFVWNNDITQSNDTASDLCFGINSVTITDANGCTDINEVDIANPDALELSNISIDNACYQICDGKISISIEGGTGPYDIEWSLEGNIFNTTDTIENLCPGIYQIKFSDANECIYSDSIPLIERDSFNLFPLITPEVCYNSCTGIIKVSLLNEEYPPIQYYWPSLGLNSDSIVDLCSDTFELFVIDERLCRDTFEFFVLPGDSMYFDSIAITHNSCFGDTSGAISLINFNGGVQPLDYLWSNSETTSGINSLASGLYTVTITDANGCSLDSSNIRVSPDLDSLFVIPSFENISCFGVSDGLIDIDIFGGVEPYFISINSVIADTNYLDSLSAGTYYYDVVDSNNCIISDSIIIVQPDYLTIQDSLVDVLCKGENTGEIHLIVTGGTVPYEYSIDGGITFQSQAYFDNLIAGSYSIIVNDGNDCLLNSSLYNISEPLTVLNAGLNPPNLLCFSDTGTIILTANQLGGPPNYSFLWNNGAVTQNLYGVGAGYYSVAILDENNCEVIIDTTFTEPSEILSDPLPVITDLQCYQDGKGIIDLSIIGGNPGYTYIWSNGENTSDINNLSAGIYEITVTDDNDCPYIASFIIEEPDLLAVSYNQTHVDCFGNSSGEIDITVSGGTEFYTYAWSNLNSSEDLSDVPAGTYDVTITDVHNCLTSISVIINEPTEILDSVSALDLICNSEFEGEISVTVSGGTPGYNYSIDGGASYQIENNFINLQADNYSVWIIDANGCTKNQIAVLNQPIGFSTIVDINNLLCNGDATGSIALILSGNSPPYTYSWIESSQSSSTIYGLLAGNYEVIVSDANNCKMTYFYLITEPESIILLYDIQPASCEEKNDGSIMTNVTGGNPPYTYNWDNDENSSSIFDLNAQVTYTLILEDSKGCSIPPESIKVGFDGFNGCVEIPSGFTPNNDNIHDEWDISGLQYFPDVVVNVYNRWGQEVYSSQGYNSPWDGKYNGVDLPIAAYYYVIELNESEKVFNGTVTIKR